VYNLIRGALFHGVEIRDCMLSSVREAGNATWRETDTENMLLYFKHILLPLIFQFSIVSNVCKTYKENPMFGVKFPIKHDWENVHRFQHSITPCLGT